jgi:tetratricopeptide (TPR) repeat protein
MERWEALYRRAVAHEMLGNPGAARADYRRAMNEDPHLRRALDAMGDRVKQVGKRHGVPVFDTIAYLERVSVGGIVGFDTFYDYVHFTPKGALQVGTQLFRELQQAGLLPAGEPLIADRYYADRLAQLRLLESDPLERGEWMGFGFDVALIADRDLWKYERMVGELDERIAADPGDVRARVYRGNARAFELGGAREAEQDYLAALEIVPGEPAILRNLAELRAERPPE